MPPATTAILPLIAITGSQRPYIYDLPHILSLPNGFEFRFRYRHIWVDENLTAEVREAESELQGRDLIILFHSQDNRRLIPIRKCTVIGMENIGPMVFVRFRVGQFPLVDGSGLTSPDWSVADSIARQLGELGLELLGQEGKNQLDLSKSLPKHSYLRYASGLPKALTWAPEIKAPEVGTAWARLAVCLLKEPNLAEVPMFHLLGFQDEKGNFVVPKTIQQFSLSRQTVFGFRLVEADRYRLRVIEWCEPAEDSIPKSLRLKTEFLPEVLQMEGASDLVVGRYDVIELTLRALRPGYTELAIFAEPLERNGAKIQEDKHPEKVASNHSGASDWPAVFAVRVPIRVRNKVSRFIFAVILCASGVFVYSLGPVYWPQYPELFKGIGLLLAFPIIGEYLERFVKFGESMRKFLKME